MKAYGFSMLETIAILIIMSIMLTSVVAIYPKFINVTKNNATKKDMRAIKQALIGSSRYGDINDIVSFGFFGDMGNLPSSLDNLHSKLASQTDYAIDSATKIGIGWRKHIETQFNSDYHTRDRYYVDYDWAVDLTASDVVATLTSKGSDAQLGTSDDMVINIKKDEIYSQVSGIVKNNRGNFIADALLTINYPKDEILTSSNATSNQLGYYSFTDIPFGVRSISVDGPAVHLFSAEAKVNENDSSLTFSISNLSSNNFIIDRLSIVANVSPAVYFEEVIIGTKTVFQAIAPTSNRHPADGSFAFFNISHTINGLASSNDVKQITIRQKDTILDDITLGDKIGDSAKIVIKGFYDDTPISSEGEGDSSTNTQTPGLSLATANKANLNNMIMYITVGNSTKTYTFTIIGTLFTFLKQQNHLYSYCTPK